MAWNPALPAYVSKLALSPGYIQSNWNAIDSGTTGIGTGFTRNHVTMSDNTNGGLHSRVDFYQAVASPSIAGFISSCYPKTATHVELFYKNTTQDIQITNSVLLASNGEGMIPGGLLIKSGNGFGLSPVTYTNPFPNGVVSINITGFSNNAVWSVAATTGLNGVTGFSPFIPAGGPFNYFWVAIGR